MNKNLLLICLGLILMSQFSFADTIRLKNGRVLDKIDAKVTVEGVWVDGVLFALNEVEEIHNQPFSKQDQNFENSKIESVIDRAYQKWFDIGARIRRNRKIEYYYNTKIEAGSGHDDMLPFLQELAQYWYQDIEYLYGHKRVNYVLITIRCKNGEMENHINSIGEYMAKKFSRHKNTEGRIEIFTPTDYKKWPF